MVVVGNIVVSISIKSLVGVSVNDKVVVSLNVSQSPVVVLRAGGVVPQENTGVVLVMGSSSISIKSLVVLNVNKGVVVSGFETHFIVYN